MTGIRGVRVFLAAVCLVGAFAYSRASAAKKSPQRTHPAVLERASQRTLLEATASAEVPAKEIETFLETELLPALAKEHSIRALDTYVSLSGGSTRYVVAIRYDGPKDAGYNDVRRALGIGRGPEKADAALARLERFFPPKDLRPFSFRSDLSISRGSAR